MLKSFLTMLSQLKLEPIPQFVEHYKKQKLFNRDVTLGQGYKEVVDYDSGGYEPVAKPSL
jgi:hypothetical protein